MNKICVNANISNAILCDSNEVNSAIVATHIMNSGLDVDILFDTFKTRISKYQNGTLRLLKSCSPHGSFGTLHRGRLRSGANISIPINFGLMKKGDVFFAETSFSVDVNKYRLFSKLYKKKIIVITCQSIFIV